MKDLLLHHLPSRQKIDTIVVIMSQRVVQPVVYNLQNVWRQDHGFQSPATISELRSSDKQPATMTSQDPQDPQDNLSPWGKSGQKFTQ